MLTCSFDHFQLNFAVTANDCQWVVTDNGFVYCILIGKLHFISQKVDSRE